MSNRHPPWSVALALGAFVAGCTVDDSPTPPTEAAPLIGVTEGVLAGLDSGSDQELAALAAQLAADLAAHPPVAAGLGQLTPAQQDLLATLTTKTATALTTPVKSGPDAPLPGTRLEQVGLRAEPTLGVPACSANAQLVPPHCVGDGPDGNWLETRSTNFVTIKKAQYGSSFPPPLKKPLAGYRVPQGVQLASSFVTDLDDTEAIVFVSAEAAVAHKGESLYLRALVDGAPARPGQVVFTQDTRAQTRAHAFVVELPARGIHTVEIQWRVDGGELALMRDASVFVQTGSASPFANGSVHGIARTVEPPTLVNPGAWQLIPDATALVYAPPGAPVVATFSTDVRMLAEGNVLVRAKLDGDATGFGPGDTVLASNTYVESHTARFVSARTIEPGWHLVQIEATTSGEATASIGRRSLALTAHPSFGVARPSHKVVVPPSGPPLAHSPAPGFEAMPGMSATLVVPSTGNGEVAVALSAELYDTGVASVLVGVSVDGGPVDPATVVDLADIATGPQTQSHVFVVKHLPAGSHTLALQWSAPAAGVGLGDRVLVATAESGRIPDVAEPLRLNGVAGDADATVQTIEPLVGERPVLVILGSAVPHAIPAERARAAVFGYGDGEVVPPGYADFVTSNARRYLRQVSHDRFDITPAATLGWFPLTKAALVLQAAGVPDTETYYWQYDVSCGHANVGLHQGFKNGHSERMHDMVQAAVDAGFDFASYDRDGDGVLDPNELGILLIHPPAGSGNGSEAGRRQLLAHQCAGGADDPQAMQAGGVELPTTIIEYFADFDDATEPLQFSTVDHELLHLFAGLGDLYQDDAQGDPFTHVASVDELSLMGRNRKTTSILDAVHRIALGWATPRTMAAAGQYALLDAQAGDVVGVLPRFNHEAFDEYLVIENRRKHDDLTGYWFDQFAAVSDACSGGEGDSLGGNPDSDAPPTCRGQLPGLAVWHMISDPIAARSSRPTGVRLATWMQVDRGIQHAVLRLIRPLTSLDAFGMGEVTTNSLWNGQPMLGNIGAQWINHGRPLLSGTCADVVNNDDDVKVRQINRLHWGDCTASGYSLSNFSQPGQLMTFEVARP